MQARKELSSLAQAIYAITSEDDGEGLKELNDALLPLSLSIVRVPDEASQATSQSKDLMAFTTRCSPESTPRRRASSPMSSLDTQSLTLTVNSTTTTGEAEAPESTSKLNATATPSANFSTIRAATLKRKNEFEDEHQRAKRIHHKQPPSNTKAEAATLLSAASSSRNKQQHLHSSKKQDRQVQPAADATRPPDAMADKPQQFDHQAQRTALVKKWSKSHPELESKCEELLAPYPSTWSPGQQLLALDEALTKTSILQPAKAISEFIAGFESWVSQWSGAPGRSGSLTTPSHLRGHKQYQEFWAIDKDLQTYQSTHAISGALLRLSKVRMIEHYEDVKLKMRLPSIRRKRGQTAAAKAKEIIFTTTFPDEQERAAALRRFEKAQKASNVLLDLCRDHSYGLLILIQPELNETSFKPTLTEFDGFRAALRSVLSEKWTTALKTCGTALVALSQGIQPSPAMRTELNKLKDTLQHETREELS